jgi:hypothetical protein
MCIAYLAACYWNKDEVEELVLNTISVNIKLGSNPAEAVRIFKGGKSSARLPSEGK